MSVDGAPVRECPLCPAWVECTHYGELCVRLYVAPLYHDHPCHPGYEHEEVWSVIGPSPLDPPYDFDSVACVGWRGKRTLALALSTSTDYATEVEARVEFARRVEQMLAAEAQEAAP